MCVLLFFVGWLADFYLSFELVSLFSMFAFDCSGAFITTELKSNKPHCIRNHAQGIAPSNQQTMEMKIALGYAMYKRRLNSYQMSLANVRASFPWNRHDYYFSPKWVLSFCG